jgi:uncharacterized protein (DUF1810 family)
VEDTFNLQRFLDAQSSEYARVVDELGSGRKVGHWMWYIFPQVKGLGKSSTAQFFAISSREEANAYGEHAILGPRLRECTELVVKLAARPVEQSLRIEQVFGYPDNLKFHSSMTLFAASTSDNRVFTDALDIYFQGKADAATMRILGGS